FRLELITAGDVDRDDVVRKPALLQHDGDLPAIGRRPVIEIDRLIARRRPARLGTRRNPASSSDHLRHGRLPSLDRSTPSPAGSSPSTVDLKFAAVVQRTSTWNFKSKAGLDSNSWQWSFDSEVRKRMCLDSIHQCSLFVPPRLMGVTTIFNPRGSASCRRELQF